VFRSTDEGTTWTALNTGLPSSARVNALAFTREGRLLAGLAGGGLYLTDEVVQTAGEDDATAPLAPTFRPAFPNPFAASTTLSFDLPTPSDITLSVYDILGRRIKNILSGPMAAGTHEATWTPTGLPSGLYVVRLEADGVVQTRRLVLAR
jgi:hypothetical protein